MLSFDEGKQAVKDLRAGISSAIRDTADVGNYSRLTGEVASDMADIQTMHARMDGRAKRVFGDKPFEGLSFLYDPTAGTMQLTDVVHNKMHDIKVADAEAEIHELTAAEIMSGKIRRREVQDQITLKPIGADAEFFAGRLPYKRAGEGFFMRHLELKHLDEQGDEVAENLFVAFDRIARGPAPGEAMGRGATALWMGQVPAGGSIKGYKILDRETLSKIYGMSAEDIAAGGPNTAEFVMGMADAMGVEAAKKQVLANTTAIMKLPDRDRQEYLDQLYQIINGKQPEIDAAQLRLVPDEYGEAYHLERVIKASEDTTTVRVLKEWQKRATKGMSIEAATQHAANSMSGSKEIVLAGRDRVHLEDAARAFAGKVDVVPMTGDVALHPAGIFSKELMAAQGVAAIKLDSEFRATKQKIIPDGFLNLKQIEGHIEQILRKHGGTPDPRTDARNMTTQLRELLTTEVLSHNTRTQVLKNWGVTPVVELGIGNIGVVLPIRDKGKGAMYDVFRQLEDQIGPNVLDEVAARIGGEDMRLSYRAGMAVGVQREFLSQLGKPTLEDGEMWAAIEKIASGEVPFKDVDPTIIAKIESVLSTHKNQLYSTTGAPATHARMNLSNLVLKKANTTGIDNTTYYMVASESAFHTVPANETAQAVKTIQAKITADTFAPDRGWNGMGLSDLDYERWIRGGTPYTMGGPSSANVEDAVRTLNKAYTGMASHPSRDAVSDMEWYLRSQMPADRDFRTAAELFFKKETLTDAERASLQDTIEGIMVPIGGHAGERIRDVVANPDGVEALTYIRNAAEQDPTLSGFASVLNKYTPRNMSEWPHSLKPLSDEPLETIETNLAGQAIEIGKDLAPKVTQRASKQYVAETLTTKGGRLGGGVWGQIGIIALGAYAGYRMMVDPTEEHNEPQGFRHIFPRQGFNQSQFNPPPPVLQAPPSTLKPMKTIISVSAKGVSDPQSAEYLQEAIANALNNTLPYGVTHEQQIEDDRSHQELDDFGMRAFAQKVSTQRYNMARDGLI